MNQQMYEADIAIIGGGFGGVAAALAASEAGLRVVMSEATDWIGGKVTAQAMSALQEHRYIEQFGGTRSYYRFRQEVRAFYRRAYSAPARMTGGLALNPGNCWASRLAFEPRVGLQVLQNMLDKHVHAGRLTMLLEMVPISASARAGRIEEVTLIGPGGKQAAVRAPFFLDATELGDLLHLAGVPYVTGAEGIDQTGEPHARDCASPDYMQAFNCCFLVEFRPGEDHTIRKPYGYESWRDSQPFTLSLRRAGGRQRRYYMFSDDLPFWRYRRVFDGRLFSASQPGRPLPDISLIDWDATDYYKENLINRSPAQQARIYNEAKRLSLSFLYWLQTEVPRDEGRGHGYPELRLLPEATGTQDGLAKFPHIRESRRLLGLRRVVEQDIIAQESRSTRAAHYVDSVGVGWHPIDMHRRAGDPTCGEADWIDFDPSLPFQVPLGALLSPTVGNVIAACRNIATTHITNAAYRTHPTEWNIGEAAGALAAYCASRSVSPRRVWEEPGLLRDFQSSLLQRGMPLFWGIDLHLEDPDFAVIQSFLLDAPPPPGSPRGERLQILPDQPLARSEAAWLLGLLARDTKKHPGSDAFTALLQRWGNISRIPFLDSDLRAAFSTLGLPDPQVSEYPTLRETCRAMKTFA